MQALREIHEVTSNTVTIKMPEFFPYKKVEVIVLPMEEKPVMEDFWESADQICEELERSGRTFSDSAELIREERGW